MEEKKPKIAETMKGIKLNLVKEPFEIKEKGKIVISKDAEGEVKYLRHDGMGLMSILSKFDTRKHTQLRDQQQWVQVRDKLHNALLHELDELDLTLDQAKFLKDFLKEYSDKDGKEAAMGEFELRSRIGILEQFGEKT